jgi:hypothetical protein
MPLIKLTDSTGNISIDITKMNPTFLFMGNNPFIQVDPPQPLTPSSTAYLNFNSIVVNLAMFAPRISISFTEGPESVKTAGKNGGAYTMGLGSDPFNLSGIYTIFSALVWLYQINREKKMLYINSASNYVLCHISSYRATVVAGQKDIVNHQLELVLVGVASQ